MNYQRSKLNPSHPSFLYSKPTLRGSPVPLLFPPSSSPHNATELFLLLVYLTRPAIYFPSSTFRGYNLFLLSELSGGTVALLDSFLALIGATSINNQEAINALGITFAVLNMIFSFSFFALLHVDTSRSSEERKVLLEANSRPLIHDGLDIAVKDEILVELWKADEEATT